MQNVLRMKDVCRRNQDDLGNSNKDLMITIVYFVIDLEQVPQSLVSAHPA
jgi:hypothetical protein